MKKQFLKAFLPFTVLFSFNIFAKQPKTPYSTGVEERRKILEQGESIEFSTGQYAYYKENGRMVDRINGGKCIIRYGDRVKIYFKNNHSISVSVIDRDYSLPPSCNKTELSLIPKEELVPENFALEDNTHQVDDFRKGQIVYHDLHYILVPVAASNNSDVDNSKQFCNIRYGEKLRIQNFSSNTHFVLAQILPTGALEDGRFYRDHMYEQEKWYDYDKGISFSNLYDVCERDQEVFVLKDRLKPELPPAEYVFNEDIDSVFSVFTIHKDDELYISHTRKDFVVSHTIHSQVCRSHVGSKVKTIVFAEDRRTILVELLEEKGREVSHRVPPVCNKNEQIIVDITSLAGPSWLAFDKGVRFLRNL